MARRRTRFSWAKAIRTQWQKSVECIIEAGRLLQQAKAALPHGQFQKMVEGDLPFGARTARMLMAIARHPVLSKRNHASVLPPSWHTIYEMTRLPEADLKRALASGKLGPETKRREVLQLQKKIIRRNMNKGLRSARSTAADLEQLIDSGEKFGCVYADPPWPYERNLPGKLGAGCESYPLMQLDDIIDLPVAQLAAKSSHLHLWTTGSFLFDARDVMEAWGFTYKSSFVWVKPGVLGVGYYWRGAHEILLFGERGPARGFRTHKYRSWLEHPRGIHSAKPPRVRKIIEDVSSGPYLELFARTQARGWTSWGNEVPSLGKQRRAS